MILDKGLPTVGYLSFGGENKVFLEVRVANAADGEDAWLGNIFS